MVSVPVVDMNKKSSGQLEVTPTVLEAEVNSDLFHTIVRWQLACRRAGTAATLTKGLVRGGGKKPFKQKGTGNARQGSSRSPLMPGGGTAFGPQPRDYGYTLQKQVRKAGIRSALSYLWKEKRLWVVDKIVVSGKTKELSEQLKSLGVKRAVIVDEPANVSLKRAARNLVDFKFVALGGINVFDLLKYDGCVISKSALMQINEKMS